MSEQMVHHERIVNNEHKRILVVCDLDAACNHTLDAWTWTSLSLAFTRWGETLSDAPLMPVVVMSVDDMSTTATPRNQSPIQKNHQKVGKRSHLNQRAPFSHAHDRGTRYKWQLLSHSFPLPNELMHGWLMVLFSYHSCLHLCLLMQLGFRFHKKASPVLSYGI